MSNFKGPLDYIDVASRIVEFRTKHPDGSLQQQALDFREVNGTWWVIYTAAAYRTPEDSRPGIGTAWEPIPGRTNFTRDSEVQNAETAAWGRAIVAALAADTKKGVASAEEVRNRQAEREAVENPDEGTLAAIAQLLEEAATADRDNLTRLWKEARDAGWMHVMTEGGQVVKQLEAHVERIKAEAS